MTLGVRAAVKAAGNGIVGVIGTKATINSGAYQERVSRLRNNQKIVARACPLLVPIVEENLLDSNIARMALEMYLAEFKKLQISSLILACTHYPLLKTLISEFFAGQTVLIDSAYETAREVKEILQARRICTDSSRPGREQFFVSDSTEAFAAIAGDFLGRPVTKNVFCIPGKMMPDLLYKY